MPLPAPARCPKALAKYLPGLFPHFSCFTPSFCLFAGFLVFRIIFEGDTDEFEW